MKVGLAVWLVGGGGGGQREGWKDIPCREGTRTHLRTGFSGCLTMVPEPVTHGCPIALIVRSEKTDPLACTCW